MTRALALVLVLWQSALCAGSGNSTASTNSTVSNNSSCEAGRLWDASRSACSPCLPGTYKETAGTAGQCDRCPNGKFSAASSSTSCQDCPQEAPYSPIGSEKRADCSRVGSRIVEEGCGSIQNVLLSQSVILCLLGLVWLGAKSKCSFGPTQPETTDLSQNAPDRAVTARQQPPAVFPMNAAPPQQVPQQIEMQMGFAHQGPPGGLPQGWEACVDQDGKTYYQNHFTQQTQWEHPAVFPMHERMGVSGFRFGGQGAGSLRVGPALVHQDVDEDATQLDQAVAVGSAMYEIGRVRV